MAKKRTPPDTRIKCLPADLSRFLGERGLLKLVLDAVQTVDPTGFIMESPADAAARPQMLLTLLTYCYATRLYGSADIEWATRYDRTVRYICAHNFPDWQTLRRFRRNNRALLEQTLAWVFKQAWSLKCDAGEADYIGYEWFETQLNQMVAATVHDRLDLAALMDGVESD
jgi:transposase